MGVDIEKVLVSKKISFGEKCYEYFRKKEVDVFFDWRYDLFKKYDTIWDKASADIKKEFDSDSVYNKPKKSKKKKSRGDEVTDFLVKKSLRQILACSFSSN